uniref:transmembrane protein 214 n=1 Tax=Myxine glutinosa TaxID=7769 RepID=UPI00358ED7BA
MTLKLNKSGSRMNVPANEQCLAEQMKRKAVKCSFHPSMERDVAALDVAKLRAVLHSDMDERPTCPCEWVKNLALEINSRLQAVKPENAFCTHPVGYPLRAASKDLKTVMKASFSHLSLVHLEYIFDHCLDKIAASTGKIAGYQLYIQLLATEYPALITNNLNKFLCNLKHHHDRPEHCLCFLWAAGQVGIKSFSAGLKVWFVLMLPALGVKRLSAYTVRYLEQLLRMHRDHKQGFGIIGPKELFPVLDYAYMPNNSLPVRQQKRLASLFGTLKNIAYGDHRKTLQHCYFPSYLSRLTVSCPMTMKSELLQDLLDCVAEDQKCFLIWKQLFSSYTEQTNVLLKHVLENWDHLGGRRIHLENLRRTVCAFRSINRDYRSSGKFISHDCEEICTRLLCKMQKKRAIWRILPWLCVTVMLICAVMHLRSPEGSGVAFTSSDSSVTSRVQFMWRWMKDSVEFASTRTIRTLKPYASVLWNGAVEWGAFSWENMMHYLDLFLQTLCGLLLSLQENIPSTSVISNLLDSCWIALDGSSLRMAAGMLAESAVLLFTELGDWAVAAFGSISTQVQLATYQPWTSFKRFLPVSMPEIARECWQMLLSPENGTARLCDSVGRARVRCLRFIAIVAQVVQEHLHLWTSVISEVATKLLALIVDLVRQNPRLVTVVECAAALTRCVSHLVMNLLFGLLDGLSCMLSTWRTDDVTKL